MPLHTISINDDDQVRRRDRWTALALLVGCWVLFGAVEQRPFTLQGAVVESLVERGRLYFVRGAMKGDVFVNLDTNTPSFRYLFNIFPHEGTYRVNHAPGQFILAAPWYAACVKLGWSFETHEHLVWRVLVWTLTAPLGALAVVCLFMLARAWHIGWSGALIASLAFSLCSPWWPAAGVLYHDGLAVVLILVGVAILHRAKHNDGASAAIGLIASGGVLGFAVVTTYLAAPIVLVIVVIVLSSRPPRRDTILLMTVFITTLAILPTTNVLTYGSLLTTGYSAGGFHENYPAPFDPANAWEKIAFYLWDSDYGVARLFPVFLLGSVGLLVAGRLQPRVRLYIGVLAAVHFLFIVSMRHHGSVGWGMGRFFLPLYPVLALGLAALWDLEGWKGMVARVIVVAAMFYSFVFALAGVWYGVQGVKEPGFPTLKLRVIADQFELYGALPALVIGAGVLGEVLNQVYCSRIIRSTGLPVAEGNHHVPPPRRGGRGARRRSRRRKK
jgi:hypothetical protein